MSQFKESEGLRIINNWMAEKGQAPFPFQLQTWQRYANGYSGMVVAPTGFGKTFSVFFQSNISQIYMNLIKYFQSD